MLAQRPPMGWNTWNTFAFDISEELIMQTADTMLEKGYLDAGYEYIVIDDCWSLRERSADGKLVADPAKFPHGMKYLSDYVHSKGFKFGIYSCAGVLTCQSFPSSYEHEFVDAKTFAEWGVDFLKYDFCNFPNTANCKNAYLTMSMALKSCGREILYSACNWGVEKPWEWMRSIGVHMYRSTGDIFDNYRSFTDIADSQVPNMNYNAPFGFNDMDMLIIGMYGKGHVGGSASCTDNEYRLHFARWCFCGTPLMIGGDVRNLNDFCRELLLNKELIAIDQDIECRPPYQIWGGDRPAFMRFMSDGSFVFAFFNNSDRDSDTRIFFKDIGLPYYSDKGFRMTDVFTGEDLGIVREQFDPYVKSHDCRMFRARICDLK